MKRIIIICLLLFPLLLFAQKPHYGTMMQEADSVGTNPENGIEVVTTEACTTDWYPSFEIMTLYYTAAKWNTTSDAPKLTLSFQTTNAGKNVASTDRTLSITDVVTDGEWKLTQVAIGSGKWCRLIVTGGAANDSTIFKPYFDGYPINYR